MECADLSTSKTAFLWTHHLVAMVLSHNATYGRAPCLFDHNAHNFVPKAKLEDCIVHKVFFAHHVMIL